VEIGIAVVDALVDLPEIEMVGAEAPERLVELREANPPVPAVRADLVITKALSRRARSASPRRVSLLPSW